MEKILKSYQKFRLTSSCFPILVDTVSLGNYPYPLLILPQAIILKGEELSGKREAKKTSSFDLMIDCPRFKEESGKTIREEATFVYENKTKANGVWKEYQKSLSDYVLQGGLPGMAITLLLPKGRKPCQSLEIHCESGIIVKNVAVRDLILMGDSILTENVVFETGTVQSTKDTHIYTTGVNYSALTVNPLSGFKNTPEPTLLMDYQLKGPMLSNPFLDSSTINAKSEQGKVLIHVGKF